MTECVKGIRLRLARWDLQLRQWKPEVGRRKPQRSIFLSAYATASLGDWPLPPNNNWQSFSTRPISGKKRLSCLAFLSADYRRQIFFNCKEMLSSTPGTPVQGRNCIYPPFFIFPLSLCFSFSTQYKLFSPCLIQQKAWKCSALSLCFTLKKEDDGKIERGRERERRG